MRDVAFRPLPLCVHQCLSWVDWAEMAVVSGWSVFSPPFIIPSSLSLVRVHIISTNSSEAQSWGTFLFQSCSMVIKGKMQLPQFELVYPGILFHEWLLLIMWQIFVIEMFNSCNIIPVLCMPYLCSKTWIMRNYEENRSRLIASQGTDGSEISSRGSKMIVRGQDTLKYIKTIIIFNFVCGKTLSWGSYPLTSPPWLQALCNLRNLCPLLA